MTDPIDDEKPMSIQEYLRYLRNRPPSPEIARETVEEVRRMRRGLPAKGPQK